MQPHSRLQISDMQFTLNWSKVMLVPYQSNLFFFSKEFTKDKDSKNTKNRKSFVFFVTWCLGGKDDTCLVSACPS
jgi:hypothetical protein